MLELSERTFGATVAQPGVQVIDFWAPWCGPCRAMTAQLERAAELRPAYRFAKVNVDDEPKLAARFNVMSIPKLAFFLDGELVGSSVGLIQAPNLVSMLDVIAHPPEAA